MVSFTDQLYQRIEGDYWQQVYEAINTIIKMPKYNDCKNANITQHLN